MTVSQNNINIATVTTKLTGEYEIGNLKPGTYTVRVSCEGYKNAEGQKIVDELNKVTIANIVLTKLPYKPSTKPEDIFIAKMKIPYAKNSGKLVCEILNAKGQPLDSLNIVVSQNGKNIPGIHSKNYGKYIITDLRAGVYTVHITKIGYEAFGHDYVIINAGKATAIKTVLQRNSIKLY